MKGIQKIDYFDFQKVILNRYIGHLGTGNTLRKIEDYDPKIRSLSSKKIEDYDRFRSPRLKIEDYEKRS